MKRIDQLGMPGTMISGSKSGYKKNYPNNIPVFNANIIAEKTPGVFEKIWFGDIDITISESNLKDLALSMDAKIWVLPEMAARFQNEETPDMSQFVYSVDKNSYEIGDKYYKKDSIIRDENDKLIIKTKN